MWHALLLGDCARVERADRGVVVQVSALDLAVRLVRSTRACVEAHERLDALFVRDAPRELFLALAKQARSHGGDVRLGICRESSSSSDDG